MSTLTVVILCWLSACAGFALAAMLASSSRADNAQLKPEDDNNE